MTTAPKITRPATRRMIDWNKISDHRFNVLIAYRLSMAIITAVTLIIITR